MPGRGVIEIPLLATMACIDHMLGGPAWRASRNGRSPSIESGVGRGIVERLLGEMRYSPGRHRRPGARS